MHSYVKSALAPSTKCKFNVESTNIHARWWHHSSLRIWLIRKFLPKKLLSIFHGEYVSIRVPRLTQDRIDFSHFSKARFSKRLEWFCSTLLLHTATMVETSRIPRFSFWNGCYRFAPNSKFHSASKDWEIGERVELSRRKYSRRRVCS